MVTKRIHSFLIAAAALCATLGVGGCVRNSGVEVGTVYVKCRAVMSKNTRAQDITDTYPIEQDFALWAFSLPRGMSWKDYSDQAMPMLLRERFIGNPADTVWTCTDPIEWPYINTLNFIAYSPYDVLGSFDPERGIVFDDYDITLQVDDLMYTDVIDNQLKENNIKGVAIPFYRALCKVDLRAKVTINTYTIAINKVTVKNLHYKGSFASFDRQQWTPDEATADFTLYDSQAGTTLQTLTSKELYGSARLLLPQTLTNVYMEVVYTETNPQTGVATVLTASTPLIRDTWGAGKYYTYTLEVKADGVGFEEIRKD